MVVCMQRDIRKKFIGAYSQFNFFNKKSCTQAFWRDFEKIKILLNFVENCGAI